MKPYKTRIAIFASGQGTNTLRIIQYFKDHDSIEVALIVCNKPGAGVIHIAEDHELPVLMIEKERFFKQDAYLPFFEEHHIHFIVLAGFLWKIPVTLINAYPQKIVNIHPALLPAYGGKGMYGHFVHEAVIANQETQSGITIHYVDEKYDHGQIIFQAHCTVSPGETPETLAAKVHQLEHRHFAPVLEQVLAHSKN